MLQQTLSAQLPEMQSPSPLQCAPMPTLPQLPVLRSHECCGSHWPPCAEVQDWKHVPVVVSQLYGRQSICVTPALQTPEPSQAKAPSTESPLQVPPTQVLPRYFWQEPAPSQSPFSPQLDGESITQSEALRGAELAARARQVPGGLVSAHVWHPPEQALLQQSPSTQ